ncbi:molybdopterin-containing oxidoreductase family protein [Ilumatobacter nonamiensis]|uniref:molybdopterin-containing oxidoreductase family protein n=1 Tax=Ilumatobacter nonamiensis TaxID=467093 RepID=UPI000348257D|nr:molybdopterin-dependent oxidoreductase [Ilumatobacter nonamiensis]
MSIDERPDTQRLVHGACHHDCPDSCGWTVTVDGSGPRPTAVKLRGNPDHPFSQGELCPKVNRFLDRVHSADRILHPLRRTGPKGSNEYEQISWDDALDEIATRLHDVIDTHGGEALLPYSDAGNQSLLSMFGSGSRFFHHLGATRLIRAICGVTVGAGLSVTNGSGASLEATEMVHSRLIVLWGTNTRLTNRHLWPTIEEARSNGARIVVIDPIRTLTAEAVDAARGDRFVQPLPGTDIAMMLAMMHVIIREGLADDEWIAQHTVGFDELRVAVADWTPARAAEVCGVDADVIESLARDIATTRPTAIRTLIGAEHHENGAMFFRTLACLPALTGAWRDRGGGLSRSVGHWTESQIDLAALTRPDLMPTDDGHLPRSVNMSRLGEVLTDLEPPIHAMVVWNCNPLVTTPNAELIRRGLERDDLFTVVHEQFLTDTARYADIVLPATTQIEADDVVFPWGHLWVSYNEAAIEPMGEACSNTELFRRLSTAMDLDEPSLFDDDEVLMRAALPTIDLAELRRERWLRAPYPEDGRPYGDPAGATPFSTASGRVEFASAGLESIGQPRVPTFVAPSEGVGAAGDIRQRLPFQLLTPKHHTRFLNSGYAQLPKHGPAEGGPFVEVCPADAADIGVADGDLACVANDRATVEVVVRVSERLRPGVVAIPFGWWGDDHRDGHVANSITNDTLTEWGGGVAFSDTLVAITPAPVSTGV